MGVVGSRWVEETDPFSSPGPGIVGPDSVAYPVDLECGTAAQHFGEVEVWICGSAGARSRRSSSAWPAPPGAAPRSDTAATASSA